jgi:hypothetical protein
VTGEKHWHGASPTTAMTHISIQEKLDGKAVDWMEQVSEAQYRGRCAAQGAATSRRLPCTSFSRADMCADEYAVLRNGLFPGSP